MSFEIPRLRMFAGPNGSGKSTIKDVINKELLGIYINPDDIEKNIKTYSYFDFNDFEIESPEKEVLDFFKNSTLLKSFNLQDQISDLKYENNRLIFTNIDINSYFASVCADFIRKKLLEYKKSFTFETVMSSYDKIELLKVSKSLGYRNYLYYISTIRTVNRFFAGENVKLSTIEKITNLLGLDFAGNEVIPLKELEKQRAKEKALFMVSLVQSTSALEVQGLEEDSLNKIINKFEKEFLVGQYRNRLWVV
ncbi:hypothetical protein ACBT_2221 [Aliarcobacter cibarius]|uniref:UDP-N-acetylglucosamine kinase n=2 Tax=Aliarcobacter cibarius TaxID=255507 RepID=A0A7L5JSB6_9BACT|nr:hypothetical protein [Aliarcobacter cibarius]QKJ28102.1 hypothetical protein ACBT_2221 [Aliarcobacter cibarius]